MKPGNREEWLGYMVQKKIVEERNEDMLARMSDDGTVFILDNFYDILLEVLEEQNALNSDFVERYYNLDSWLNKRVMQEIGEQDINAHQFFDVVVDENTGRMMSLFVQPAFYTLILSILQDQEALQTEFLTANFYCG